MSSFKLVKSRLGIYANDRGSSVNCPAIIIAPMRIQPAIIDEMNHVDIDGDR